jgi:GNAT superfamily N-acetyltransferase
MISIASANSAEDFDVAAGFCRALGELDALEAPAYGMTLEEVAVFHTDTSSSLATKYNSADARIMIARWESAPAGCLAFDPFDEEAIELHRFWVDPRFRGKGIGRELVRTVIEEAAKGRRRRLVLHTASYLKTAIALYASFGFTPCARFRPTPDSFGPTDVFLSRTI